MTLSGNCHHNLTYNLTPYFLLGVLTKPFINMSVVQIIIDKVNAILLKNHPSMLARMAEYTPALIKVVPIDLPLTLLITLNKDNLTIKINKNNDIAADATLSSTLKIFMQMLEGKTDGDALFFSRQLIIEGNTELIVAFRNVLEAENINLQDEIVATAPFFHNLINKGVNFHKSLFNRLEADMNMLQKYCLQPIEDKFEALANNNQLQTNKILDIENSIADLKKRLARLQKKTRNTGSHNEQ